MTPELRVRPQAPAPGSSNVWALILAGGDEKLEGSLMPGERASDIPRQYYSLAGGASLLQRVLERAQQLVPREQLLVCVTEADRRHWEPQLRSVSPRIVAQQRDCGSGLSTLLALHIIAKADPRARVLGMTSDHFAGDGKALNRAVRAAMAFAASGTERVLLLMMTRNQDYPSLGFFTAPSNYGPGLHPTRRLFELIDPQSNANLLCEAKLADCGIFTGRVQSALRLYARQAPDTLRTMASAVSCVSATLDLSALIAHLYERAVKLDLLRDIFVPQSASLQLLRVPYCDWSNTTTLAAQARILRTPRAQGVEPIIPAVTFESDTTVAPNA